MLFQEQLSLGLDNISPADRYLFDVNIHDLMEEPGDCIRGWLCDMLIARGDVQAAKDECLRPRLSNTVNSNYISARQRKEFLDWRNISLS